MKAAQIENQDQRLVTKGRYSVYEVRYLTAQAIGTDPFIVLSNLKWLLVENQSKPTSPT